MPVLTVRDRGVFFIEPLRCGIVRGPLRGVADSAGQRPPDHARTRWAGPIMATAWLISTGTELALGQAVDTNAPWLARELAALGVRCVRQVVVPDEPEALRDTLLSAVEGCDLVIITGGLGPTADDVTRPAVAAAAGCELISDPDSLEQIRAFFAARGRAMPDRNRIQALRPASGRALPNRCGTAPGIRIAIRDKVCFALPGVPFEMKAMFAEHVAPELRRTARGNVLLSRTLQTFGAGESEVASRLGELMTRGRNPEIGTTAQLGVISVRINASAESALGATALLDRAESEVRRRLGPLVFGRDEETLASAVGRLLTERGETVATAESCTGGLIGKLLTDVPGSSRYYAGGVVSYSNALKHALLGVGAELISRQGAVSQAVALAMARGARERLRTTYALAVTGVAGPEGGTPARPVGLVFAALATPREARAHELRFGPDSPRDVVRTRAAHSALNLLRLELLKR